MSSTKFNILLSLGAASGLLCALASSPARAGDDGAAPIWVGLYSLVQPLVSIGDDKEEAPSIDYRDHGRLVVPPKIELPPPASSPAASNPAWPVDNEKQKKKRAKAEAAQAKIEHPAGHPVPPRPEGNGSVTINADVEGVGPAKPKCQRTEAPGDTCTQTASNSAFSWNPLTWVGAQKKGPTTLGPEPDRDWLTDPPKGYRAPVEGVGAKLDN
jgi:hypothetical protein